MTRNRIEKIVIAGNGLAGWLAAAAVSNALRGQKISITVVGKPREESCRAIASLPITQAFNQRLEIDERTLMNNTGASFSLGTRFRNWTTEGNDYFLPLAPQGGSIEYVHFHNYAIKARLDGDLTPFNDYSLCAVAAMQGKFAHPVRELDSILSTLVYAHHFDASQYTEFFRRYSAANGVRTLATEIRSAQRNPDNGFIDTVTLEDGQTISADFYLDCSGLEAVLAGAPSDTGFEDWSKWLPANRVLSVTGPADNPPPCSEITALESGWHQVLPMRERQEHRLVFSEQLLDDDSARLALKQATADQVNDDFEFKSIQQGHRLQPWVGNCLALGDTAGMLEPLANTGLALIQSSLMRLLQMFPDKDCNPLLADEFNRLSHLENQNIRDFVILQHHYSQRTDSAFWSQYNNHPLPSSLEHKIRLFMAQGQVAINEEESFPDTSWASVWLGLEQWPAAYDPMLENYDFERLKARFDQMKQIIQHAAQAMPPSKEYLGRYSQG